MQLRFESTVPGWFVVGIALLGAFLLARWYYRESRTVSVPWSWLLPLLRTLAFLLMIAMLSGPVVQHEWIEGQLSRVSVLVDTSRSMGIVDPDSKSSRLELVRDMLLKDTDDESNEPSPDSWLYKLARQHHVKVYSTLGGLIWDSQTDKSLKNLRGLQANDGSTPLGESLMQQWKRDTSATEGTSTSTKDSRGVSDAIVLITDGQNNTPLSPLDAVGMAGSKIPVHTVGVGVTKEPVDFAILSAEVSQQVRREDRIRGKLRVKEIAPPGTAYEVSVRFGELEIYSKLMVAASRGVFEMEFDTPIASALDQAEKRLGQSTRHRAIGIDLDCRIQSKVKEVSLDNNLLRSSTWGIIQQNQVLILDPRGRWEFRYLRNALERDPTWKVLASIGPTGMKETGIPKNRADLFTNDLIVAASDVATSLNEEQLNWLVDYIRDSGGGLVWIDSDRKRAETAERLAAMLPVLSDLPNATPERTGASTKDTALRITPSAVGQPAFQLDGSSIVNQSIWENFPPFHSFRSVELKPGAEPLLENKRSSDLQWQPLVATSLYGQGRVLYFATDETWRWRYGVADLYHQRFWNQVAGWVMRSPYVVSDSYVSLDAGKRIYNPDESVVVRAKVSNESSQPHENGVVQLHVLQNDAIVATFPMREVEKSGGTYRAVIELAKEPELLRNPAEEYELRVSVVGIPDESITARTSFWISPTVDIEMQTLACNEELLKSVAEKSGGQFYRMADATDVVQGLEPFRKGRIVQSETILWQSYPWFIAIMALLATEWYLRKQAGLF